MAHALVLGRRGQGRCWPNPAVGCVIVRDGRVVGRGWTQPGGRPHAETQALARAGAAARGATAYVTLEPCAHDDSRVAGRGLAMLRAAGIAVETGVLAQEAARDHAGFFLKTGAGRPFVTLKLATTLDGRIATATGESQWITGPGARREVHALRARHDAVMVGGGTARADDPALTVRGLGIRHQPLRIVVSRKLDLPLTGQLAQTAGDVPVWLCHGPDADPGLCEAWEGLGARLVSCRLAGRQVDMRDALHGLGAAGAMESVACLLMLQGGFVHPSINCEDVHPEIEPYAASIPQQVVETPELRTIIKAGFGFGDVNVCVVFRKWSD